MTQLEQAIAAIKHGDKEAAKHLLAQVVRAEPRNEEAWVWLAYAVDDIAQKRYCLGRVLGVNPNNRTATQMLVALDTLEKPETAKPTQEKVKAKARAKQTRKEKKSRGSTRNILLALCAIVVCACWALSINRTSLPVSQRTPSPIETRTTSVARTSSPAPADIADDLRIVIESNLDSCCPGTQLRGNKVQIEGREIFVMTSLDRSDLDEFYAAIGMIHGVVAEIAPDMSAITIKDITGQQITVKMLDLLAFYNDQMTWDEYRATWVIVNP